MLVVQTLQKSDASLGLVQAVLSAGGILGGVLAGTVFVRHPIRSGTPLLLALSGVCAALGLALRVSVLQFGSILVLGAVFMAVAALFNVCSLRSCKCWCRRHSWAKLPPVAPCWPA